MEETIITTVEIPTSLMKETKLLLTQKHGNPHGHWRPLIIELLKKWVEAEKE